MTEKPLECLAKLGEKRDRSVNFLVVEEILGYLDRHEKEEKKAWPSLPPRPGGGGFRESTADRCG